MRGTPLTTGPQNQAIVAYKMQVDVIADDNSDVPDPGATMHQAAKKAVHYLATQCTLPFPARGLIQVVLVDDPAIGSLNAAHLGKDEPTDVLAFDYRQNPHCGEYDPSADQQVVADIFVSADTAAAAARTYDTSWDYEVMLYIVHGLLHLCGYRDDSGEHAQAMHCRESEVMAVVRPWVAQGLLSAGHGEAT